MKTRYTPGAIIFLLAFFVGGAFAALALFEEILL